MFCSYIGTAQLVLTTVVNQLEYASPGWGTFQDGKSSTPETFEMILEILAVVFLIQFTGLLARLVERRHDVIHYLAKSNPG
jgi:hypothetical protein